jgi:hypothetical protein
MSGVKDPEAHFATRLIRLTFTTYCLLPATSEKDRVVARKHSDSIQDYSLQGDVYI